MTHARLCYHACTDRMFSNCATRAPPLPVYIAASLWNGSMFFHIPTQLFTSKRDTKLHATLYDSHELNPPLSGCCKRTFTDLLQQNTFTVSKGYLKGYTLQIVLATITNMGEGGFS